MEEKLEYKIIWASSPDKLSEKVNEYINSGWDTLGGLAVGQINGKTVLFQAVMK